MIYSWEKGFIEDKEPEQSKSPPKTILRKDPLRKSGQALTKQLKGKIATKTDSTFKATTGSIYRKSDIDQTRTTLTHEKKRSESKSPSAEPTKKFQRISSPEVLEDIGSDEELQRDMEIADSVNPVDRFQQSQTVTTSKDTNAGGGLNLAIKRAKPNMAGPSLPAGQKSPDESARKKTDKKAKEKRTQSKQNNLTGQTAIATDQDQEQSTSNLGTLVHDTHSSSTPKSKQKTKLKFIDSQTSPEDILDTFQNRNLAPAEWENFADQLLKRGVQRVAGDIRGNSQPVSERDTAFEPPQGVSDESSAEESGVRRSSRQTKNKEPKRFGDPIKHSTKEISEDLTGVALLKTALQEYRRRLRDFKERSDRPVETKLRMLERHLFRRKFGYATLDKGLDWNPSCKKELEEN